MRLLIIFLFLLNTSFAFEGRVHTADGMGVESATITLKINNQEYQAISGERGTFYFFDVAPNTDYEIIVSKAGHGSNNVFGNSTTSQNISIELNPEIFVLSGKVVTKTGEAISEAQVTLEGVETKTTGADGAFSFNLPYGANFKITLQKGDDEYFFYNSPKGVIYGDTERIIIGEYQ